MIHVRFRTIAAVCARLRDAAGASLPSARRSKREGNPHYNGVGRAGLYKPDHSPIVAAACRLEAYITLDEGTRGARLHHEKGAGQRRAARPQGARLQARATADFGYTAAGDGEQLALVNPRAEPALAGEGTAAASRQDLRGSITPISVPSLERFCSSTALEPAQRSHSRAARAGQAASPSRLRSSRPRRGPHPKLRGVAQDNKAQVEVWSEFSKNNASRHVDSTDAHELFEQHVGAQMDDTSARSKAVPRGRGRRRRIARKRKPVWATSRQQSPAPRWRSSKPTSSSSRVQHER